VGIEAFKTPFASIGHFAPPVFSEHSNGATGAKNIASMNKGLRLSATLRWSYSERNEEGS